MQTQAPSRQTECCQRPTTPYFGANVNSALHRQTDPRLALSTGASRLELCMTPAISVPYRSATAQPKAYTSAINALTSIVRSEGLPVLFRGIGPAAAMSVPASAAGLLIYDSLRSVFLYSPSLHFLKANALIRNSRQQLAPILAGAIGRTVVATVFSPIELFRTRLQSLPRSSSFTFVLKSIVDVVKTKGFRTLWKGLPATLWRDVPFSSVYWFSYETLQKATTGSGFGEGVVEKGGEAFANSFFCDQRRDRCRFNEWL